MPWFGASLVKSPIALRYQQQVLSPSQRCLDTVSIPSILLIISMIMCVRAGQPDVYRVSASSPVSSFPVPTGRNGKPQSIGPTPSGLSRREG